MKFSSALLSLLGGAFVSAFTSNNVIYNQNLIPSNAHKAGFNQKAYTLQTLYPASYPVHPAYQITLQQPAHASWYPASPLVSSASYPGTFLHLSQPPTPVSVPSHSPSLQSHQVFPPGAVVNSRQRSSSTGSGTDSLAIYCRNVYDSVATVIPTFLVRVMAVTLLLPGAIAAELISPFIPNNDVDYVDALFFCVASSAAPGATFGPAPNSAVAKLADGPVNGTVYFAQTVARADAPAFISIMARVQGLTPGQSYAFTIHQGGDLEAGCAGLGGLITTLNIVDFVATEQGTATVTIHQDNLSLDSIVGRSVVVAPVGVTASSSTASACGVVVRNVLSQ